MPHGLGGQGSTFLMTQSLYLDAAAIGSGSRRVVLASERRTLLPLPTHSLSRQDHGTDSHLCQKV